MLRDTVKFTKLTPESTKATNNTEKNAADNTLRAKIFY